MNFRCNKKSPVLVILALFYVCIQGCHTTSSLGDQHMKGYSFLIKVYNDSAKLGNVPKLITDFAGHEGFSELPRQGKCIYFYKSSGTGLSRLEPIRIFCCQVDKTSPELPDFHVAVYSWGAESASVKAQIDNIGQAVYEMMRDNGAEKMTVSKERIGYH